MATVSRRRDFDETGRILPISAEEQARRVVEANQALDGIMEMGSEEEQRATLELLMKHLNQDALPYRIVPGFC